MDIRFVEEKILLKCVDGVRAHRDQIYSRMRRIYPTVPRLQVKLAIRNLEEKNLLVPYEYHTTCSIYQIEDFAELCIVGMFTDDSGEAWGLDDNLIKEKRILPSDILKDIWPEHTLIAWFNK